jgi:glycerophosphoryl diester phosphodiesterase
MDDSPLKKRLGSQECRNKPFRKTDFSIGHRGAPLQFPEHTREIYEAAARMGAGIVECDVTFTKDKELVCRHAQNDLHTTTNILAGRRWRQVHKPFTPATFDADGNRLTPAPPSAAPATSRWPSSRPCAARWTRSNPRTHRAGIPGRHRQLAHRSLQRPDQRHAADARREHRAVQATRREDDARTQVAPACRCPSTASASRTTRRR